MPKSDYHDHDGFVEKFKPKLTTDDCYTPTLVYDAVLAWVREEYRLDDDVPIVRPFYPGGDYENFDYPPGCVVVDNPPFSILAKILWFFKAKGIRFFLFAPALTLFSSVSCRFFCAIPVGVTVTYENGAKVATSFLTSMEDGIVVRTAPSLYRAIEAADKATQAATKKVLPKYAYPDEIITAAMVQRWCKYGIEYRLKTHECVRIGTLDAQRGQKKSIFGCGYLLSERAAAERAAAERAAAERAAAERAAAVTWKLSEAERDIVRSLTDGTYYDKTQFNLFDEEGEQ